ncbi:syntaxin, Qa-SNARE family, putative [Plasmodium gallinaceum]|uniref:Syntaxin, Qa-SNARE family, putative n=1 Tax=Plasmodium gallinaceum TaxID=5849 RepID=A0A1J1GSD9_PLAGA|nr:syntaxin, Qa-SNARE family, putative [Plasmodium gallinaceum]CRG95375.1 syntaxin, Qa-SNARE family, putative [Plasmodium gallinaceum]
MIDLFDKVKTSAISKNKQNAKQMMQTLIFKNDIIIDNVDINEDTIINVFNEKNNDLKIYVDTVDKIKQEIQKINSNVSEISSLKNKINISITVEEENELSLHLNTLIKNTNEIIQSIKIDIRNLRKKFILKTQENRAIKKDIYDNLINIFKKSLHSYQHIQNVFHHSMKDKISRHIKIIYPNYSDEDVNYVLNHDDVNTQILVKWKLQGHEDLKNALTDVETKYKDVKTLEKSVYDLHQTIIELSALIEMNDEVIDNIHENIKDAQIFTEKANVDLIEARNIQRKTSKWMCYITIGIVVVIIIICVPILVKFI